MYEGALTNHHKLNVNIQIIQSSLLKQTDISEELRRIQLTELPVRVQLRISDVSKSEMEVLLQAG